MSKERFVTCFMADQAARRGAKADFDGAEVSSESLKMLNDMERKMQMSVEREGRGYAAERASARRAKEARKRLTGSRRRGK